MIFKRLNDVIAERDARKAAAQAAERERVRLTAEREAEEARQRAEAVREAARVERTVLREHVNRQVEWWQSQVAPLGTPVEVAVETALKLCSAGFESMGYNERRFDDSLRPIAVRLARKFARPDEQVLAALEVQGLPHKRVFLVVFTHGFGVKIGGQSYRSEAEPTFHAKDMSHLGWPLTESASLVFGDVMLLPDCTGSSLFWALKLQQRLRSQPAARPRGARARGSRPTPRLIRTARDAELVAAEWMRYFGYTGVVATPEGADGGVDVVSNEAVAQVKAESVPTGRPKIQQHHGVATAHGKQALFFSLAGYTPQARTFAEENGLLLFSFDLQGEPQPVNTAAHALNTAGGLGEPQ